MYQTATAAVLGFMAGVIMTATAVIYQVTENMVDQTLVANAKFETASAKSVFRIGMQALEWSVIFAERLEAQGRITPETLDDAKVLISAIQAAKDNIP